MTGRAHTSPSNFMSMLEEQPSTLERSMIQVMEGFNPRRVLASGEDAFSEEALADLTLSIREQGILQPLLVRPASRGMYELVAGERRFHAAGFAGVRDVPVYIRALTDEEARRAALTENGQREAIGYAQEAIHGLRDIARMVGVPISEVPGVLNRLKNGANDEFGIAVYLQSVFGETVSNWAQRRALVLKLRPEEISALNERQVNLTALQQLIRLGDQPERQELLARVLTGELTVEELTAVVTGLLKASSSDVQVEKVQHLRRALPRLSKLSGAEAARASELIKELLRLIE